MSMLVTCPNCGPREVQELRCAGEIDEAADRDADRARAERVRLLPRATSGAPSASGGSAARCEDWFLAERAHATRTRSRDVTLPAAAEAGRVTRLDAAAPASGSTARSRSPSPSTASRCRASRATRSAPRSTPPASASSRAASSTTGRAGSSAAPVTAPNCQMTVDGDPERARLHDAAPRGRGRQGPELRRLARPRPDAGDRQARRPVHAARLLLQDVHPPAQALAAVREVPARRRRASGRSTRTARARSASTSSTATSTSS